MRRVVLVGDRGMVGAIPPVHIARKDNRTLDAGTARCGRQDRRLGLPITALSVACRPPASRTVPPMGLLGLGRPRWIGLSPQPSRTLTGAHRPASQSVSWGDSRPAPSRALVDAAVRPRRDGGSEASIMATMDSAQTNSRLRASGMSLRSGASSRIWLPGDRQDLPRPAPRHLVST